MSATDAAKRVKKMFGLGRPPTAKDTVGNLTREPTATAGSGREPTVQLNLRVPARVKHRVRVLAVRDQISLSDVMMRALDAYEEKFGRAPEL
jgi:hypothetical protein